MQLCAVILIPFNEPSAQARFAHIFGRKEPRQQAKKYVRGLLAAVERKNSWQLAEAVGDRVPDPSQRLLYHSRWEADEARDELEQYVIEVFGEEEGIGVVDETGFIKKGQHSVGVKRQYSGLNRMTRSARRHSGSTRSGSSDNIAGPLAKSRIVK